MATVTVSETKPTKERSRTRSGTRTLNQTSSPQIPPRAEVTPPPTIPRPPPDTGTLPLDREREATVRPYALKVRAAKGVLTQRINEAETTIRHLLQKGREGFGERDVQDLRDHLSDVRAARESVATSYYNLMGVDVPQMTETYDAHLEEQMEKANDFEQEIKQVITRWEMEGIRRRTEGLSISNDGLSTPNLSEGSGNPETERTRHPDRRSEESPRLNLNIPVPDYPPPPRPDANLNHPPPTNVPPPTIAGRSEPFIVPGRGSVNPPPPPVNPYGGPHYSHGHGPPNPPTPGPPGPPGGPGGPGGCLLYTSPSPRDRG